MNENVYLNISINLGIPQQDETSDAMLKIEATSHYIWAVFWAMKKLAEGEDLLDLQTESQLFTFIEFRENVRFLSDIGAALADKLTVYNLHIKKETE